MALRKLVEAGRRPHHRHQCGLHRRAGSARLSALPLRRRWARSSARGLPRPETVRARQRALAQGRLPLARRMSLCPPRLHLRASPLISAEIVGIIPISFPTPFGHSRHPVVLTCVHPLHVRWLVGLACLVLLCLVRDLSRHLVHRISTHSSCHLISTCPVPYLSTCICCPRLPRSSLFCIVGVSPHKPARIPSYLSSQALGTTFLLSTSIDYPTPLPSPPRHIASSLSTCTAEIAFAKTSPSGPILHLASNHFASDSTHFHIHIPP